MHSQCRPWRNSNRRLARQATSIPHIMTISLSRCALLAICILLTSFGQPAASMTPAERESLRQQTAELFYHGFDNYMEHAFPEDELRPVSCTPLTRDRENPAHIELNDVLGNYSLTLIDSLSTLAILASTSSIPSSSSSTVAKDHRKGSEGSDAQTIEARDSGAKRALRDFKTGVQMLVEQYGDATAGDAGQGLRGRGFDLDSKVQVFETVIRGVGGLLSAHLFATGELPIAGYDSASMRSSKGSSSGSGSQRIVWENGFVYDGQLLRLAKDLAERLLPAFVTDTKIPYPRVNLRNGVPFYANSPLNRDSPTGLCPNDAGGQPEITETCSAGAGSLVLEFATLSRLTGDGRFETAAIEAFWAVWRQRSAVGLIGAGIDAETGKWITPYTGIGAGIDSFFEYAFKSHVLLSGLPSHHNISGLHVSDAFLDVWKESHAAIKRHMYRGDAFHHPHYIQTDVFTGAARAFWIDSLSAYYPGLLALSGEVEEAAAAHLLYTALWSRYGAMPERWSTHTGDIEQGLRWWGGRPEFVESAWYLYRATKDPWYQHVGEMVLKDIQRRCRTKCGWAGLQDVQTGEKTDRMESFFLGETAKYLYLLFDEDHPLNNLDAPFVFTTEGHPMIVPRKNVQYQSATESPLQTTNDEFSDATHDACPAGQAPLPFTISHTAARGDVFHAAALARLELMDLGHGTAGEVQDFYEPTNRHPVYNSSLDFFPWTLPKQMIPANGTCNKMMTGMTFDLSFPNYSDLSNPYQAIQRVPEGILLNSLSGIRLGMVRESQGYGESYRIYSLLNVALGRDEKVFIGRDVVSSFNPQDPYFTRVRDTQVLDLVVDVFDQDTKHLNGKADDEITASMDSRLPLDLSLRMKDLDSSSLLASLVQNIQLLLRDASDDKIEDTAQSAAVLQRYFISGAMPTGQGVAPFHTIDNEHPDLAVDATDSPLAWKNIYVSPHDMCSDTLDPAIPRNHQIIVVARGGCSFSSKLQNIPTYPPTSKSLQLVVIVSHPLSTNPRSREWALSPRDPRAGAREEEKRRMNHNPNNVRYDKSRRTTSSSAAPESDRIPQIQPLLQEPQLTPSGMPRANPIAMVLVDGGDKTVDLLRRAKGIAIRRRWWYDTQGVRIDNLVVL